MHADVDQFQMVMLNFRELFSEDHPTSKLLDIIHQLDLSSFDENYVNSSSKGGRKDITRLDIQFVIEFAVKYVSKSVGGKIIKRLGLTHQI